MDWKTCNKNLPRLVRLSAPRAIPRLFRVLTSNIAVSQPVTGLLSSITLVLLYLSRIDGMAYHEVCSGVPTFSVFVQIIRF